MNTFFKRQKGFTLLELLVVISIIGILVAIGAAAFATAQSKSRDGRRRSDMQAMQKGFEQYYADNAAYADCSTMASSTYLPAGLPVDPQSGQPSQSYSCSGDATGYCACATLEDSDSGNAGAACDFTAGTKDRFCVTNLQ